MDLRLWGVTGRVAASSESYCDEKKHGELNETSRIHGYLEILSEREGIGETRTKEKYNAPQFVHSFTNIELKWDLLTLGSLLYAPVIGPLWPNKKRPGAWLTPGRSRFSEWRTKYASERAMRRRPHRTRRFPAPSGPACGPQAGWASALWPSCGPRSRLPSLCRASSQECRPLRR